MNAHVFVDESKARGLLLAAAVIPAQEVASSQRLIDSLRMPRQRRIHFTAESDTLRYTHKRAHEEPLLAIPDAVAWSWANPNGDELSTG